MKKVVLVTSLASKKSIMKYQKLPLIGIERGIELIAKCNLPIALGIGDFDTLDYELVSKYLKPNQIVRLKKEKDLSDTEAAVIHMQKLGFDEIVILASLAKRYDHSHALLLLTNKFSKCKIYIEDDNNFVTYLAKGSRPRQRQHYIDIGVIGFPKAMLTLDNSKYPMKKMKLDFTTTKAISNELLERVVSLEVHKGGVLVVQSKDDEND